ncbi:MAG: sulfur carrier protein ThiS [bacterium]|nr:sulfur carrier protein ThiS [bacterium]
MHVDVNGQRKDIGSVDTLGDLLRSLGIAVQRVAVEVNDELVNRTRFDTTRLAEADRIEIVTFVGGG